MATGHSILDTLNATSKGGQPIGPSGKFRTKDLPISQLYRNEGNFYGIVEIEELAGKILMAGLMENLAVVYDPCPAGQYRIVSGERRWEALKLLVSRGHNEFAVATCNVRTKRSQEEETIDLILANAQRVKSVEDQLQEYSTLKATLERMRANGQQLEGYDLESGRLRDVIAAILNKSTTKIAQLERINGHLIPELRALLDTGALKFSAAYNLAGMDEQAQQDAFRRAQDEGREITHQEAKQARTAAQAAAESNPWASGRCEMVNGACDHYPVIKANFLHNGQIENCAGCCQMCNCRDVCDFCCGIVAAQRPVPAVPVKATEAEPKVATSLCFSCESWDTCMDRTDKTISCQHYMDRNEPAGQDQAPSPVRTYTESQQPQRNPDEDMIELIRDCIRFSDLGVDEANGVLEFFDQMAAKWRARR